MRYDQDLSNKVKEVAQHVITTRQTVRQAAEVFGLSKSYVHNYLTVKLPYVDPNLMKIVRVILDIHLEERAINGGKATKISWEARKNNSKTA